MKTVFRCTLGILTAAAAGLSSYAAIILDDQAVGFVGKGDVQLAFAWNNKHLQDCVNSPAQDAATDAGCLRFHYASSTSSSQLSETTWSCTHPTNGNTNQRARRTTTSSSSTSGGVSASVARVKNQVTGFNLNGGNLVTHQGQPVVSNEGPPLGSCPNNWTASALVTVNHDPVVVSSRTLTVTDTRDGTSYAIELE